MNERRALFLSCSRSASSLIARPELGARWDRPSVLEKWTVGGVAGHLLRATGSVAAYLDRPEPSGPPISAAAYLQAAIGTSRDLDADLHRAIRARGDELAAEGHGSVIHSSSQLLEDLELRLQTESEERMVEVYQGLVLLLDDYLATRIIEIVVHCDDLALSVGLPTPSFPGSAIDVVCSVLLQVARLRHGDTAVVRALTRRERDDVEALRVI